MIAAAPLRADILLVEDDEFDLELTLRVLRAAATTVSIDVVRDGAQALEYLLGHAGRARRALPRLVLLDLKLPRVDGLQVLQAVKADLAARMAPIVVMTSSAEERDLRESYRLGANSYVVKPIGHESFEACVTELGLYWLARNRTP